MSPLTQDERAEITGEMRASGRYLPMRRATRMAELADKLEAEPEPEREMCTTHPERAAMSFAASCRECYDAQRREDRESLVAQEAAAERGEALRDLLDALDANASWIHPHVSPVVARAREVLDGVERTHAPVPVEQLESLQSCAALQGETELAKACEAAARGERVHWPTNPRTQNGESS